jgi:hypothetical protein
MLLNERPQLWMGQMLGEAIAVILLGINMQVEHDLHRCFFTQTMPREDKVALIELTAEFQQQVHPKGLQASVVRSAARLLHRGTYGLQ